MRTKPKAYKLFLAVQILMLGLLSVFIFSVNAEEVSVCEKLYQKACMEEPRCAYTGKFCRPTNDPCEIAWLELEGTLASCESMTACDYIKAEQCYCPPDVICVCGGGAPEQCRLGTP